MGSFATVLLDILEQSVKQKWMNVEAVLAKMEDHVKMAKIPTSVTVKMVTLEIDVRPVIFLLVIVCIFFH